LPGAQEARIQIPDSCRSARCSSWLVTRLVTIGPRNRSNHDGPKDRPEQGPGRRSRNAPSPSAGPQLGRVHCAAGKLAVTSRHARASCRTVMLAARPAAAEPPRHAAERRPPRGAQSASRRHHLPRPGTTASHRWLPLRVRFCLLSGWPWSLGERWVPSARLIPGAAARRGRPPSHGSTAVLPATTRQALGLDRG